MQKFNVGLIGYRFMGKAHSNAYLNMPRFFAPKAVPVMKSICGRNEKGVKQAAEKYGWERYETDWQRLIKRDDIDLVDITTPNNSHYDMAVASARAGKHILCEKPLGLNTAQAEEMLEEAEKNKVKHMICFNYRFVPAIVLAKRLIDEGKVGRIYHFRATYLQDWLTDPGAPFVWRNSKEVAGSGAHGDLNAHHIDLARYLIGEFGEVAGASETFIKERMDEGGRKHEVTVDDAALFLARFKNGALGSFEATRFAAGRKNFNRIEINGSKGSIVFNFEHMNELEFFSRDDPDYAQGFRTIMVTEPSHTYAGAWWPPGHIIGYQHTFVHLVYELMNSLAEDRNPTPNFYDGLKCQEVLEAVENSISEVRWVKI